MNFPFRPSITLFSLLALSLIPLSASEPTDPDPAPSSANHLVDYPETWFPELAQILGQAEKQAPQLIIKAIEREEAVARLEQAKAAYYPRLDFNGNFGYRKTYYNDDNNEDTDNLGITFNASIRRPIYYWGAIEARIRQARLDYNNDELERTLTLRRIKRSIRADYLSLLVNQIALRNARHRRQSFEDRAAQLRADFAAGQRSAVDTEQNSLNLNEAIMNIEALETEQERILANFKRDIGWQASLDLTALPPPLPTDAILAWLAYERGDTASDWIAGTGEVLKRRNTIEREKAELVRITANQRPLISLTASAGYGQSNTSNTDNVDTFTLFLGLSANWNIFDGFETSQRKRESNLRRRRIETALNAYEAELRAQSDSVLSNLTFQTRRLAIQQRRYELASDAFARSQRDRAEGQLSDTAFRDRQQSIYDRELDILRARTALLMGLADYLDLTSPALLDGSQRSEARGQKTEDRSQRAELGSRVSPLTDKAQG